jgi:hypothetical protein
MSIEHWWSDTGKGELKHSEKPLLPQIACLGMILCPHVKEVRTA